MAKEKKVVQMTTYEGQKVKPQEKVKVIVTNSKFHDNGKVIEVHPVQAEKLIANQKAVKWSKADEERIKKESEGKDEQTTEKVLIDKNKGGQSKNPGDVVL